MRTLRVPLESFDWLMLPNTTNDVHVTGTLQSPHVHLMGTLHVPYVHLLGTPGKL